MCICICVYVLRDDSQAAELVRCAKHLVTTVSGVSKGIMFFNPL